MDVSYDSIELTTVLLSSNRDFETEKDWELLRNDSPYADALRFEEVEATGDARRYEMVVTKRWASKVSVVPRS